MTDPVSRRDASKILLGGALVGASGLASGAFAQPAKPATKPPANPKATPATPVKPPEKSFLEDAIKKGKTHDWVLKPTVHVQAYQEDTANAAKDRPLIIGSIAFKTAAVLFPVIRGTSSSETLIDDVKSELTFNDRTEDIKADYNESYHSGVRLGRWEMRDKSGREVELKLEIPMSCWETVFDEKAASKATWPTPVTGAASGPAFKWPRMAQATFGKQAMVDMEPADGLALKQAVSQWTEGKSPQSISPLMLAKTLTGKVLQSFQPSGDGEDYDQHGSFTGLELQGPAETIRRGIGSPHDITAVLVGAMRTAGLPARLVVGWDESETKGDDASPIRKSRAGVRLRSWAEFCLFDEPNNKELWVPVDVVRMRKRSTQLPKFDQPWRYFGSHDDLDSIMPFAFHYIPPTTVISYGYAFWGWFTTPTTQVGEHWLRFQSQTAPKKPKPKDAAPPKNK